MAESKQAAQERADREIKIQLESEARDLELLNQHVNPYRGGPLLFQYQVAPRRRLKTRIGELVSGAQVRPDLLPGGDQDIARLVREGVVLRNPLHVDR